jgi:hypothetical protein
VKQRRRISSGCCLILTAGKAQTNVSSKDRYAKEAASRIQRAWQEGAPRLSAASRSSIALAERALRSRRRRRVLVRRVLPALVSSVAVGAIALAWLSLARRSAGDPTLATDAHALMLLDTGSSRVQVGARDRALGAGDQVFATLTSSLRLGDGAGTTLTLEPGAMLTVVESTATRRFALRQGAVEARVRKLVAGERFIIETPDAEIEVHGTEFRVAIGEPETVPCTGTGPKARVATRVSVTGGVVSVKWSGEEQRLLPGDEWPPRCAQSHAATSATDPTGAERTPKGSPLEAVAQTAPPARRLRHREAGVPTGTRSTSEPPGALAAPAESHPPRQNVPPSVLEAQNDLFISAVRARRAGQNATALALFDRFMREYPDASLFESALVQKMRLLAAMSDLSGAGASARQYLARFPDGFARDEARALLGARRQP